MNLPRCARLQTLPYISFAWGKLKELYDFLPTNILFACYGAAARPPGLPALGGAPALRAQRRR